MYIERKKQANHNKIIKNKDLLSIIKIIIKIMI